MSVCPKDFQDSAVALATNTDEMSKRNAISRAYYAAYHLAISYFPFKRNPTAVWSGLHKNYWQQLMQCDVGTNERFIGIKLQAMHTRRITADYKCAQDLAAQDLAMQLTGTQAVFDRLKT